MVLTGITNGSCSDCATLNGTYILASTLASDVNCLWQYNLPSAICGFNYVFVQLRNIGGGTPYRVDSGYRRKLSDPLHLLVGHPDRQV